MKRILLCFGLVIASAGLIGAGSGAASDDGTAEPACRIVLRAYFPAGALGSDKLVLNLRGSSQLHSRVKVRGGSWSRLGRSGDVGQVIFFPDGSWEERVGASPGKGSGRWEGGFTLNLGCRYNRRYEFKMTRERAAGGATTIAPLYPSSSTWTKDLDINLGNVAKYF